jgi:hypothetical protein
MKLSDLKQLIREELSRFEFMKKLANEYPELSAGQVGKIYALYKKGERIENAVAMVAGINEQEEVEKPAQSTGLQKAGIEAFRTLGGVQTNETDIVELLVKLIELAKQKNINTPALRRALTMVKKAAEQIKE